MYIYSKTEFWSRGCLLYIDILLDYSSYDCLLDILQVKNPWPNVDAHSGVLLNHFGLSEDRSEIFWLKYIEVCCFCRNYSMEHKL